MTFGEKLRQARQNAKMSQEELANKICVSRSAIAKWETDKGMPDINNLKAISYALGVSIDYLLDDGTSLDLSVVRENIDLSKYGKGRKKVRKDKAICEKYPEAEIIPLAKGLNNLDNEFYLVNDGAKQYLVMVTSEFMESRELAEHVTSKNFELGNYKFTNCGYIVYA